MTARGEGGGEAREGFFRSAQGARVGRMAVECDAVVDHGDPHGAPYRGPEVFLK